MREDGRGRAPAVADRVDQGGRAAPRVAAGVHAGQGGRAVGTGGTQLVAAAEGAVELLADRPARRRRRCKVTVAPARGSGRRRPLASGSPRRIGRHCSARRPPCWRDRFRREQLVDLDALGDARRAVPRARRASRPRCAGRPGGRRVTPGRRAAVRAASMAVLPPPITAISPRRGIRIPPRRTAARKRSAGITCGRSSPRMPRGRSHCSPTATNTASCSRRRAAKRAASICSPQRVSTPTAPSRHRSRAKSSARRRKRGDRVADHAADVIAGLVHRGRHARERQRVGAGEARRTAADHRDAAAGGGRRARARAARPWRARGTASRRGCRPRRRGSRACTSARRDDRRPSPSLSARGCPAGRRRGRRGRRRARRGAGTPARPGRWGRSRRTARRCNRRRRERGSVRIERSG